MTICSSPKSSGPFRPGFHEAIRAKQPQECRCCGAAPEESRRLGAAAARICCSRRGAPTLPATGAEAVSANSLPGWRQLSAAHSQSCNRN